MWWDAAGSPPGASLWSQCSPQASCPGGKPLGHCEANKLNLLLVLLQLHWSLDQSADRNHSSSWENFYFCLLQRTPDKVFASRKGVSCGPFPA